jgi:hypothetical protein
MAENAYNGEVCLHLAGETVAVRYDWDAIGALRTKYGPDWNAIVAGHLAQDDVEDIAFILHVGLGKDTPWTPERIRAESPPLVPVAKAIQKAFNRAYWGITESPEEDASAKSDPRMRWSLTRWLSRIAHGADTDSRRQSSGA